MSIISTISAYILENTELTPGTNFFQHRLPDGYEEGVVIQSLNSPLAWNELTRERFTLFIFLRSWSTINDMLDTLSTLLHSKRGTTTGEWTVVGDIDRTNYGLDDQQRFVSTISFNVAYKGD